MQIALNVVESCDVRYHCKYGLYFQSILNLENNRLLEGKIILNWIFKEWNGGHGLD
jgi:hypothetical protein